MATNPMQAAKKKFKELVEMDKRLAKGEEIQKYEFDRLVGELREYSQLCLAFGARLPVLGSLGNMTSARISNAIKRAQDDVMNPELFSIKDGIIKRVV